MTYYLITQGKTIKTTWYVPQKELSPREKEKYYELSTTWCRCKKECDAE